MNAEGLLDWLAPTLEEIMPGKFGDKVADVESIAHDKQLKTDTLFHTLADL